MIKKIIGFILLAIATINVVGLFAALGRGIKLPYPPMYYILLIGLIVLGLYLVTKKKEDKKEE